MSSTPAGQVSDPGEAWGRWEKVARPRQGPGVRQGDPGRSTLAPHDQHDPPEPPRSSPTHPGHAHLQVPGTLRRQLPCRLACWEFTPAHVMLLKAGKRGVASPGRLPGAPRPLGPTGRLGAALRSPPLLLSWDRVPRVEGDLASHRRVGGAGNEGWGFRGSGEFLGLQMGEALGALVWQGGRRGQGLTLVLGRWHSG